MVESPIHRFAIGRAGYLAVAIGRFDHQIVTSRGFSRHAERIERIKHNGGRDGFVVFRLARHKGKAGIAQIVEYRTAAAAAARQADVVLFHTAGVTLFPRILRAANNDRISVAPEKQDALGGRHLAEDALFYRQVKPGIVRVRD